jgi:hypothetical protein
MPMPRSPVPHSRGSPTTPPARPVCDDGGDRHQGKLACALGRIDTLYRAPGDTPNIETALQPGELIRSVVLLPPPPGRQIYRKLRERASYGMVRVAPSLARVSTRVLEPDRVQLEAGPQVSDLGRRQKLRAAAGQRAAPEGALPENLLTRRRNQAVLRPASPSRRRSSRG